MKNARRNGMPEHADATEHADRSVANEQSGNARNAGQKDGDAPAADRAHDRTPPARSGAGQVDLKTGSADAGVHGGNQPANLQQGSQRQRQELLGHREEGTRADPGSKPHRPDDGDERC